MHVNMKTVFIIMGEVIHVLNIMKCMDSDIMYIMIYGTPQTHEIFHFNPMNRVNNSILISMQEGRRQEAESRRQRAGSREQEAESRKQRAGGREQEVESRKVMEIYLNRNLKKLFISKMTSSFIVSKPSFGSELTHLNFRLKNSFYIFSLTRSPPPRQSW